MLRITFCFLSGLLGTAAHAAAQISVSLTASPPSPQPVGTVVTWTATVTGAAKPLYQFLVFRNGQWNIVRDQGAFSTLPWTMLQEGAYMVSVRVTDSADGAVAQKQVAFTFNSRVTAGLPVVSATAHPLVALYSAPPCDTGSLQVRYQAVGAATWQTSPPLNCQAGASLNFYLAGMLPNTTYQVQQVLSASGTAGPRLTFQTGAAPFSVPVPAVLCPPGANTSPERILLSSFFNAGQPVSQQIGFIATDLSGNLLWYYPDLVASQNGSYLVRPAGGGTFLVLLRSAKYNGQILREVDLAGNLMRETNVPRLNAQLTALGKSRIAWLSHDAIRTPNGHTLVLGSVERQLTDVQGPGAVDVLGDMVLDLDQNFQLAWTWNAFDFLDQARLAVLRETCSTGSACPPLSLAADANDWTHANTVFYLPDGNLLVSLRNQDWVVKIQYQNGTGSGAVLWRLGPGGDFTLTNGSGPFPWFSHQHSIYFDGTNYGIFDNGNTRVVQEGGGNSRGQVYALDEAGRTATLLLNADLGAFSYHWGSAQTLSNGNYHFLAGDLGDPAPGAGRSVEILPGGVAGYIMQFPAYTYRSFRLKDLYTYK